MKRRYKCPKCGAEVVLYYKADTILCNCKSYGLRPKMIEVEKEEEK